jgi:hypothetical protein
MPSIVRRGKRIERVEKNLITNLQVETRRFAARGLGGFVVETLTQYITLRAEKKCLPINYTSRSPPLRWRGVL